MFPKALAQSNLIVKLSLLILSNVGQPAREVLAHSSIEVPDKKRIVSLVG